MPRGNKRKTQSRSASAHRWVAEKVSPSSESSGDEYRMDIDDVELSFKDKFPETDIGDLAEICKLKCDTKYLSTLVYMSLRFFDVKWKAVDEFLKNIGLMTAESSHKWATVFITGDYEELSNDLRGVKQTDSFYDKFPEIESDTKAFVVQACSQKSAEFKAADLAQFIDTTYYELTGIEKQPNDDLIRSERSCRLDLRRWGAKFEANSQRPYFEGHERDDVVKHRNEFINYFLTHKDFYYTITDGETPIWNMPTQNPHRILIWECTNRSHFDIIAIMFFLCLSLIVHDESTFRSGKVSPKRWFFKENIPFFSKGRGRSHMLSNFLVEHPSGPFFQLSEDEWKQAVAKYKTLTDDSDVNYVSRTATASINIGTDAYFDNDTILSQFERLFQMLEFKQAYKGREIEIIVDNVRTHTTKVYSLQDFGKGIDTQCSVEKIEYVDENGVRRVIDCYFKQGPNKGKSKGLVEICMDLGVKLPAKVKLEEIHEILSKHPAFKNVSQRHSIF
ncbi:unnamed protein product [Rotaria sp. Silwood2]|nr:unnamed protein product [Rotaria sp. Silwood2]